MEGLLSLLLSNPFRCLVSEFIPTFYFKIRRRRRLRPKRYSENDSIEEGPGNEAGFDSDDDIVGEVVYDEEYLKKRKQRRDISSSSEGDEEDEEEDQGDEYNLEDEEEDDDDDDDDDLSISEDSDSDKPRKVKQLPGRTRRETKRRSVDEIQSGLRRSKRATRNTINYQQYELSESETEVTKPEKSDASGDHSDPSENGEYMSESEGSGNDGEDHEMKVDEPVTFPAVEEENELNQPAAEKLSSPGQEEAEGMGKRRFLDLNELAPSPGFDDGPIPDTIMKDEDNDY